MAGILSYEPKYESDEEDEIINELNLDDEIDGAGGLTLNGELLCFVLFRVVEFFYCSNHFSAVPRATYMNELECIP